MHSVPVDEPFAGQVFGSILHSAGVIALVVQNVRMYVKHAPSRVNKDEVTLPTVVSSHLAITSGLQQFPQLWNELAGQGDVEVLVSAGLFTKQGIHRPTSVHIHFDPTLLEPLN